MRPLALVKRRHFSIFLFSLLFPFFLFFVVRNSLGFPIRICREISLAIRAICQTCGFVCALNRDQAQATYLKASHVAWVAGVFEAVLVALEKELEEESESRERGAGVKRLTRCLTLFNAENLIRTRTWPESKAEYCISQSRAPLHLPLYYSTFL